MADRKNMYFFYVKDKETDEKVDKLGEIAEENGFHIVDNPDEASIIVSIGGDGTFLQAVRKTNFRQDCIYTGIMREGQSGLYCDFNIDNFDEMLDSVLHGELEVRRFPVIKAQINDGTSFYCLNEVTIRSTIVRTIVIDVQIDGNHFERFRGDGLVVSTPTGSTGYAKSAKGAVMDPLMRGFQVSEVASLNNNLYRTLGSSFILDQSRELVLEVLQDGNDYPIISTDNEAIPIRRTKKVKVTMDDTQIKTVKLKNNSFWDRVQRTFL